ASDAQVQQAIINTFQNYGIKSGAYEWVSGGTPTSQNNVVSIQAEYIVDGVAQSPPVYVGSNTIPTSGSNGLLSVGIKVDYVQTNFASFFAPVIGINQLKASAASQVSATTPTPVPTATYGNWATATAVSVQLAGIRAAQTAAASRPTNTPLPTATPSY